MIIMVEMKWVKDCCAAFTISCQLPRPREPPAVSHSSSASACVCSFIGLRSFTHKRQTPLHHSHCSVWVVQVIACPSASSRRPATSSALRHPSHPAEAPPWPGSRHVWLPHFLSCSKPLAAGGADWDGDIRMRRKRLIHLSNAGSRLPPAPGWAAAQAAAGVATAIHPPPCPCAGCTGQ